MKPTDPITIAPTIAEKRGSAWRIDHMAARAKLGLTADQDATVAAWIIEAQWAHPIWHSYALTLVHLRPMVPPKPTKFYLDGATHEFWLEALDPDRPRESAIRGEYRAAALTPLNFAAQFIAESDDHAATRIREAAHRICHGTLSPDTDFIWAWSELFGDNMIKERALA